MKILSRSIRRVFFLLVCLLLPLPALAVQPPNTFVDLVNLFSLFLRMVVTLLFALALVVFLWGMLKYLFSIKSGKAAESAKNYILYGLIGLFVMASVWGLVWLLSNTFFLPGGSTSTSSFETSQFPWSDADTYEIIYGHRLPDPTDQSQAGFFERFFGFFNDYPQEIRFFNDIDRIPSGNPPFFNDIDRIPSGNPPY